MSVRGTRTAPAVLLAAVVALTLGPALPASASASIGSSAGATVAVATGPPYRMVVTRKPAVVTGLLALARRSGLRDPKRCYAVRVARHSARWGTVTYSRWAWSHTAYDGSGPCHPGEGGVSLARKGRSAWRWTGAYTGGGDSRSDCLARARAAGARTVIAKDFCGRW